MQRIIGTLIIALLVFGCVKTCDFLDYKSGAIEASVSGDVEITFTNGDKITKHFYRNPTYGFDHGAYAEIENSCLTVWVTYQTWSNVGGNNGSGQIYNLCGVRSAEIKNLKIKEVKK